MIHQSSAAFIGMGFSPMIYCDSSSDTAQAHKRRGWLGCAQFKMLHPMNNLSVNHNNRLGAPTKSCSII